MPRKKKPHIHAFGFQITDMIVAEMVKSYILHMPVEAAKEQLTLILNPGEQKQGQPVNVNVDELAALIENAKAMAGIAALEWKAEKGERLLKTTISFLRDDFLPALDGRVYAATVPEKMVETLEECRTAISAGEVL